MLGKRNESTASDVYDPLEGFNYTYIWDINYDYPESVFGSSISLAYVDYTQIPIRSGITYLANLDEPASVVNNLVMGNGTKSR